jgi:hypothetical protein
VTKLLHLGYIAHFTGLAKAFTTGSRTVGIL